MLRLNFEKKFLRDDVLYKAENTARKLNLLLPNDKNILIKSENFYALSALLKYFKEKIDLIYIDPPFNTMQDFFISEGRANTVSAIKTSTAYSDKMSFEKFLAFMWERLILIHALLSERGSLYLHIDCKSGHYLKILLDEIFGAENFRNDIARIKSNPKNFHRKAWGNEKDMILFYVKQHDKNIWNDIRIPLDEEETTRKFSKTDSDGRRYTTIPLHAPGETQNGVTGRPWRGLQVPAGRHWRTDPSEFDRLDAEGKIEWSSNGNPRIKKYADEHAGKKIQDVWTFKDPQYPVYPTEKNHDMLNLIISQSSLKESFVLDCFAGSGSTLVCANGLGRHWIGVDQSEAAINIIRQNNIGEYDFFEF